MKKLLRILKIALWVLLVSGAGVLVGFTEVRQYSRTCRGTDISIDYGSADVLITKKAIDSLILKNAGILKGKPLGLINAGTIEAMIGSQPYVDQVTVFEDNDGVLFVRIKQREPLIRIINNQYENFYLDYSGALLPVSNGFSARVPVATGNIDFSYLKNPGYRVNIMALSDSIYNDSLLTNLYRLAMYIHHDSFLKALTGQVFVNESGEFEIIPRLGDHVIILGTADDLQHKFKKLFAFYKLGLNRVGWNRYNVINIKFKNQVVCSKI
jgi:cell division protein FtsQ